MAQAHTAHDADKYYIPHGSKWPIVGSVSLFVTMSGAASLLNGLDRRRRGCSAPGCWLVATCSIGWFGTVIDESQRGMYNEGVDKSFRMGMMWFIFSEVMFFAAFFGALYYARQFSVPWLGGEGVKYPHQPVPAGRTSIRWPTNGPATCRRRVRDDPGVRPAGNQHGDPADLRRHDHDRASRAQGRQPRRAEDLPRRSRSCWASCSSACRPTEYMQAYHS